MLINGKIGHCGYKNRIVRRSQILLFYTFTHNAVGTAMSFCRKTESYWRIQQYHQDCRVTVSVDAAACSSIHLLGVRPVSSLKLV